MSGMPLCPTGIIKGAIHHVLKRTCFLARFQKTKLIDSCQRNNEIYTNSKVYRIKRIQK